MYDCFNCCFIWLCCYSYMIALTVVALTGCVVTHVVALTGCVVAYFVALADLLLLTPLLYLLHSFIHSFIRSFIHSFIHSGHFYSAPSSPLLLRGDPDYSMDTTWRLERESNPRPSD